ncbi:MAG: hypothetical protein DHS20C18_08700 [Saprospiraceae bacterium]|nr:MAG: hypothetical protein DHS20C18_08700 [Saprospiraceae bacterium]
MNSLQKILAYPHSTLFLDRDGVINRRLPGRYVRQWAEFEWLPGVPKAIAGLNRFFGKTILVTNQQGIKKGLMSEEDLAAIHGNMQAEVRRLGGNFDLLLHCPELHTQVPNCRKPAPGMAIKAKQHFPQISFEHALMVGDSITDLQFGKNLGMTTVLIMTNPEEVEKVDDLESKQPEKLADFRCGGLLELLGLIEEKRSSSSDFIHRRDAGSGE